MHRQSPSSSEQPYRNKAQRLANLLVAFRSCAHLYPTRESRRAWVERILFDIRFGHQIVGGHNVREAVIQFCLGHIGVRTLGDRLRAAFRNSDNNAGTLSQLLSPTVGVAANAADGGVSSSSMSAANLVSGSTGTGLLDEFWQALYEKLRSLTVTPGSTNDGYDARIEFATKVTLDLRHGMPGVIRGATEPTLKLVADSDCAALLAAVGHLNRSMVDENVMMLNIDAAAPIGLAADAKYPVYVFGSNCIWIKSDAEYTLPYDATQPPILDEDGDVWNFIENLLLFSGGMFIPDQDACAAAAAEKNVTVVTSLSRNDVSLQLSFATPDSRFYTANLFYMRGGDMCTTDVQYLRQYLSNACQCEDRLSHWRLVVSVAAFDGGEVDQSAGGDIAKYVLALIRAFQRTKVSQGAHFFINQFTVQLLINYFQDSIALGGMNASVNIADDNTAANVCYMHRWLRGHTNPNYWRLVASQCKAALLLRVPQLIVVYRPLVSPNATATNGPNLFLNYKTFEDVMSKYVLLSLETLGTGGYGDKPRGVAYESGDNYWIFTESGGSGSLQAAANGDESNGDNTRCAAGTSVGPRGQNLYGDIFLNPERDVTELFSQIFAAPSRLYVHAAVLSTLGFNVAAASGVPARTFMHSESDTRNMCTVFCTCPMMVIDEATNQPLVTPDGAQTLRVLKDSQRLGSVLHYRRAARGDRVLDDDAVKETIVSLDDFWPGVRAVMTSFREDALKHVQFVFFTATDGSQSLQRLTKNGLVRLNRFNIETSEILPPPVLYVLQQMFVHMTGEPRPRMQDVGCY